MITSIWSLWHFLMSYTVSVILIDLFASRRVDISQPFLLDTPLKSRPGALSPSFEALRDTLEIYIWCIRIKDPYLSKMKSCVIKISSSWYFQSAYICFSIVKECHGDPTQSSTIRSSRLKFVRYLISWLRITINRKSDYIFKNSLYILIKFLLVPWFVFLTLNHYEMITKVTNCAADPTN